MLVAMASSTSVWSYEYEHHRSSAGGWWPARSYNDNMNFDNEIIWMISKYKCMGDTNEYFPVGAH